MSKWEYTETELWRCGQGEVAILHVFGVTAYKNTVLAFAEARYGLGKDADEPHDIWMRRSTDGGRSFEDSVCLVPAKGVHCYTNPTPLWDMHTGRVFLFYSENLQNTHTKNYLIHSDDGGLTWSAPACINPILDNVADPPAFHLAGPGHGIQLTQGEYSGRLLVQFWHRHKGTEVPAEERGYCISTLYSDDHGVTWTHTPCIYNGPNLNESQVAETATDIYWNIRTKNQVRNQCRSTDGGASWSAPCDSPVPLATVCQAGCIGLQAGNGYQNTVLVSHVSDTQKRRDMEICISTDGGESFTDAFRLPPGDVMPGYSDLCLLDVTEPTVGLVHCRDSHVLFSRISLQALTGGKFENTTRSVWNW